MDEATKKVEATVLEIPRGSDMESVTENKEEAKAAEEGDAGRESKDKERKEDEEEDEGKGGGKREYGDQGDLILCRLSSKRRVTLSEFKGRSLVSIREFYVKDGKEMPSAKGISMTMEQWEAFSMLHLR
uniref:RNA polymerase II transcriptional coactivator KELP n=1 Tax=Zea mays TaxID=4577 RepID=B6U757_MAIZE|nr:RNA polymerase II transcriptional coactivator KELP [Zea mays]|eukprot:NP_001151972.1 RNA polymerase II transcriptional coactivator KELP [Zea mays]